MAYTMDTLAYMMEPLAVHEPCLGPAAAARHEDDFGSARHEDDFGWLNLEPLLDDWAGWLIPVNRGHNDAARPTSPSSLPSQPTPVLLPVAPIAEDFVNLSELTPPTAPAAANPSCHAASKGEKRLPARELTLVLRFWMERRQAPYASLAEKKMMASALGIPVTQVTNFCNNFRKRYAKVGDKLTSYRELASSAQ